MAYLRRYKTVYIIEGFFDAGVRDVYPYEEGAFL